MQAPSPRLQEDRASGARLRSHSNFVRPLSASRRGSIGNSEAPAPNRILCCLKSMKEGPARPRTNPYRLRANGVYLGGREKEKDLSPTWRKVTQMRPPPQQAAGSQ